MCNRAIHRKIDRKQSHNPRDHGQDFKRVGGIIAYITYSIQSAKAEGFLKRIRVSSLSVRLTISQSGCKSLVVVQEQRDLTYP